MAHWSVTVEHDGENIVTIESNCLCGRDLSAEDEETICTAAVHLLSFIGRPYVLKDVSGRPSIVYPVAE